MHPQPQRPPPAKYHVMKPKPHLTTHRRAFLKTDPPTEYELALLPDAAIRRYRVESENIDRMLQMAEWRHEVVAPVVRCLYLSLLSPVAQSRKVNTELYVQHIEVPLAKLKKLLLHEAMYLIVQATKGYQAILGQFNEVSINQETFGLNAAGKCVSWLNCRLQLHTCETKAIDKQIEIFEEILRLVKAKSEPICQNYLNKMEDYFAKKKQLGAKKIGFQFILNYLAGFAKNNQVSLPENLKYLVNQHRLMRNLLEFKTQSSINDSKEYNETTTNKIVSSKENMLRSPKQPKRRARISYNVLSTLRRTVGLHQTLLTCRSLNRPKHLSCESSKCDEPVSLQFETIHKFKGSHISKNAASTSTFSNKQHSRCKSQSSENIHVINNIRSKKLDTARSTQKNTGFKRYSGISDNVRTAGSIYEYSKHSDMDHSLIEAETIKKIVKKSLMESIPGRILQNLNDMEEYESHEASPYHERDKPTRPFLPTPSPLQSVDPTFHVIPDFQVDEIFKANHWTNNVRNLLDVESRLKTSITEGQDTNAYLSDVRLQKLDGLSRQMVVSLIPQGSDKSISQVSSLHTLYE